MLKHVSTIPICWEFLSLILCALTVHLSLPLPLATAHLHGFAFSRMAYSWTHTGSRFSDWFLPLNMYSRFLHVFLWPDISIIWTLKNTHCLDVPPLIHSLTEGFLGCFQFWAIMNKAAVRFLRECKLLTPLGNYHEAWWSDQRLGLSFVRNHQTVLQSGGAMLHPPQQEGGSCSSFLASGTLGRLPFSLLMLVICVLFLLTRGFHFWCS